MAPSGDETISSGQANSDPDAGQQTRTIGIVAHRIDSRDLFAGRREIIIMHGSDTYRLRLTSQNRLILTK
jgi:hemin uptake protein HemP